jgi:hypothetical protein
MSFLGPLFGLGHRYADIARQWHDKHVLEATETSRINDGTAEAPEISYMACIACIYV